MKKRIKSRDERIYDAFEQMKKALDIPYPDIQINMPCIGNSPETHEMLAALKLFITLWKKYLGTSPTIKFLI